MSENGTANPAATNTHGEEVMLAAQSRRDGPSAPEEGRKGFEIQERFRRQSTKPKSSLDANLYVIRINPYDERTSPAPLVPAVLTLNRGVRRCIILVFFFILLACGRRTICTFLRYLGRSRYLFVCSQDRTAFLHRSTTHWTF